MQKIYFSLLLTLFMFSFVSAQKTTDEKVEAAACECISNIDIKKLSSSEGMEALKKCAVNSMQKFLPDLLKEGLDTTYKTGYDYGEKLISKLNLSCPKVLEVTMAVLKDSINVNHALNKSPLSLKTESIMCDCISKVDTKKIPAKEISGYLEKCLIKTFSPFVAEFKKQNVDITNQEQFALYSEKLGEDLTLSCPKYLDLIITMNQDTGTIVSNIKSTSEPKTLDEKIQDDICNCVSLLDLKNLKECIIMVGKCLDTGVTPYISDLKDEGVDINDKTQLQSYFRNLGKKLGNSCPKFVQFSLMLLKIQEKKE